MLIIADNRIPDPALEALKKYGEVLLFETSGITYPAISGHPDIFLCKTEAGLVVAANTPKEIKTKLKTSAISFSDSIIEVGSKYPQTAIFNAVITDKFLIHNLSFTNQEVLKHSLHLEKVEVKQAYTRCNLLALKNDKFITSDKGIEKKLLQKGLEVLFVKPRGILLTGFEHGFFGGTCGVFEDKIFFIGSLNHFPQGEKVKQFLNGYEIIELYNGPLFDGGSLIFAE